MPWGENIDESSRRSRKAHIETSADMPESVRAGLKHASGLIADQEQEAAPNTPIAITQSTGRP